MAVTGANVGTAWISVVPETSKIAPAIKGAIKQSEGGVSGRGIGSKLASGIGTAVKGTLATTGVVAGGMFATSLAKGFGRMNATSNAQAKLEALGNSAEDVSGIMENALASVKGTAFGIGEAAGTAATIVASGIEPGEELEGVLKAVSDTAAVAGTSMEDMGLIFGKAAAKGKLDGEIVAQLLERQLPVYDILSEKMGVASEDIADMVTKGEVDFQTFSEAMSEYIGGGAVTMADTFDGAMMNMGAAMGRFGEKVAQPLYDAGPVIFTATRDMFDGLTEAVEEPAERIGESLAPAFEGLATLITDDLGPALGDLAGTFGTELADMIDRLSDSPIWGQLGDALERTFEVIEPMVPSLMDLADAFIRIAGSVSVAVWESLLSVLEALAPILENVVVPLIDQFATFAENNPKTIENLVKAFLLFEGVKKVSGPVGTLVTNFKNMRGAVGGLKKAFSGNTIAGGILEMSTNAKSANPILAKLGNAAGGITRGFVRLGKVLPLLKGFVSLLGGPWVVAIGAAVGALTWFFTQTELGQELWGNFTDALGVAVDLLVEKFTQGWNWLRDNVFTPLSSFVTETLWPALQTAWEGIQSGWDAFIGALQSAWENILQPVINAIVEIFKWAFVIITTVVLTPLKLAWEAMSAAIQWAWENLIKPALDAMGKFFTETLWPAIQGALDWISDKWDWLADAIGGFVQAIRGKIDEFIAKVQELWADYVQPIFDSIADKWAWLGDRINDGVNLIRGYWDHLIAKLREMWDQHVRPVLDWISDKWDWLSSKIQEAVYYVTNVVWPYFQSKLRELYDKYVQPILDNISEKWDWLGDRINDVKDFIVDVVFDKLRQGIDTLKGWVEAGVDAMGRIWDGLKEKFADPINFIINWVYNDGIKEIFDTVAEKVGLDARLPKIDPIGGYARGGILPGWSTMADGDDQLVPMRRGEGVLVSEGLRDSRSRDTFLAANEAAKSGLSFADFVERARGFAIGGILNYAPGGMSAVQASHARFVGKYFENMFALTSTNRNEPGSYHDFGVQGATDWQAQDGQYASQMPTPWSKQLAQAIAINFPNSRELIHYPLDGWQNILDGSPHVYSAGTNAGHGNHVHWATGSPIRWEDGELVLDDLPGSAGSAFNPLSFFTNLWDRVTGALPKFDGGAFGELAEWPGAALKTLGTWIKDWALGKLKEWAGKFLNFMGIGTGAGQWRDTASEALRRLGYDDSALEAMLQQIDIESSGDPRAINNWDSNAMIGDPTVGLLQVRQATFDDMRRLYPEAFEDLPNDRTHPLANLTAGVAWSKTRYGGPQNVWPTRDGYAEGGIVDLFTRDFGGLVPSGALVRNTTGRDELMLPPETTRLMNRFFAEFPEVAVALTEAMEAVESAAVSMEKAMDFTSMEGITARQTTRAVLGLGIDIPGADLIAGVLDAEQALWTGRERHVGHLSDIEDKQKALEEAQQNLIDLQTQSVGLSTQQQRKLDDAQAALDEARAEEAAAGEGIEDEVKRRDAQAKAADKVADAEEKLRRVREDIAEDGAKSEEKRAEEVEKAHDDIMKAETDLYEARKAQIMDLDHIVVLSQENIDGWGAQADKLGTQLINMGVSAAMVGQGLGAVSGALGALGAAAGPAGVTLGMALELVKVGIQIVKIIEEIFNSIIEKIRAFESARWKAFSDYAGNIAEINALVTEQRQRVVDLAADWVEATVRMADATREVTRAVGGAYRAALEGAQAIADIEARIRDARATVASGGSSSGPVPMDMGLLYDSYSNVLTATPRTKPTGATTQDVVDALREIEALQHDLLAAQINAQVLQAQAALDLLTAQYDQWQAQMALVRLEEKLSQQIDHLNRLTSIQVQFAMNEQQARLAQSYAEMMEKVADADAAQKNIMDRIGHALDFDKDGKVFGWLPNYGSLAIQGAEAQKASAIEQMGIIEQMAEKYGGLPDMGDIWGTIDKVATLRAGGKDAAADMMMWGSEVGDPSRMLDMIQLQNSLTTIDQNQADLRNSVVDLLGRVEYLNEAMPLQDEIFSLENARDSHTAQAEALRTTSEDVKAAAEALSDFYAHAANEKPSVFNISIPSRGQMIDPDDLAAAFNDLARNDKELDVRVRRVEARDKAGANAVLETKS